jgi:hypothetical protein
MKTYSHRRARPSSAMPAKADIQGFHIILWISACAGITGRGCAEEMEGLGGNDK